jgi:hypothetical protein
MTQSGSEILTVPVAGVVKIVSFGGNLYTATGRPLYRYFPVADMSRQQKSVPWADHWSDYILTWIRTYVPFPRTTSDVPAISRGGLNYQDRTDAAPDRAYQQATFRGWPLYTCDLDTADFNSSPQGTVPGLFELVSICEPWVVWGDTSLNSEKPSSGETDPPDVGWPNYLNGP